ncbi:MAG: hypothetical protein AB1742_14775 [bacterium]
MMNSVSLPAEAENRIQNFEGKFFTSAFNIRHFRLNIRFYQREHFILDIRKIPEMRPFYHGSTETRKNKRMIDHGSTETRKIYSAPAAHITPFSPRQREHFMLDIHKIQEMPPFFTTEARKHGKIKE